MVLTNTFSQVPRTSCYGPETKLGMRRNQVNRLLLRFFELLTHNWKVYDGEHAYGVKLSNVFFIFLNQQDTEHKVGQRFNCWSDYMPICDFQLHINL